VVVRSKSRFFVSIHCPIYVAIMVIICDVDALNTTKKNFLIELYQGMIVWYVNDGCCGIGTAKISPAMSARSSR